MSKIPVQSLYDNCEMMLRDGWGYIWGTSGEVWTQKKQDAATREMTVKYGSRWIGKHVVDCSGVLVYIWRQHGLSIYHGSNTIRRKYCGPLQKTPVPGYAALKLRDGDDFYHIGIVAEDGMNVYEARGTQTGFVTSAASSWNGGFAPFLDVDYYSGATEHTGQQGGDQVIWQGVVETENGRLNVRSGPGTEYPKIGSLPKGEFVDVFAEKGDWAFIAGDGLQGYVSKKYLKNVDVDKPAEPEPVKPEEPEEPDAGSWAVVIPFENETEARRFTEALKNAVLIREKPPDVNLKGE